ncbi:MAG: HAD hydrolase-like protein, partial [Acidobacteria bacterium]|nr:HAD hydrolase-like protein [Acidobacteriota bacterium]
MTESNNNGKTKIRLILFDFDGTLVNTIPLILRSFHATWLRVSASRSPMKIMSELSG